MNPPGRLLLTSCVLLASAGCATLWPFHAAKPHPTPAPPLVAAASTASGDEEILPGLPLEDDDEEEAEVPDAAPVPSTGSDLSSPPLLGTQDAMVAHARLLVGLSTLRKVARDFPDDCSGFIRFLMASEKMELSMEVRPGENLVRAFYRYAARRKALRRRSPQPGDLLFFRDTYDRNRDGLRNDGLTHIALVENVLPGGTVTFIHRSRHGVTRERMNLKHPRDHFAPGTHDVINDYVRAVSDDETPGLASQLFAGYASTRAMLVPDRPRVGRASRPSP